MIAKNIFKELGYDDYDKSYSAILYINSKEDIRIWFDTIEKKSKNVSKQVQVHLIFKKFQ